MFVQRKTLSFLRHGSQHDPKEKIYRALRKWVLPEVVGCSDLYEGFSFDLSDIVICLLEQSDHFKFDPKFVFHKSVSGSSFTAFDDDMDFRLKLQQIMSVTDWRIELKVQKVNITVSSLNMAVAQIIFDHQDHIIFNAFPAIRLRFPGVFDMIFELGELNISYDQDFFFQGKIWYAPTSLLHSIKLMSL